MIVWVQQVDILYTKASRGAPEATRRNQLPRSFLIHSLGESSFYFEHYKLLEWSDFVPKLEESTSATSVPQRRNALALGMSDDVVRLGLVWNRAIGQPRRADRPRALSIRPGQTARLSINGRYASYSGQVYTEATYNVAVGDRIANDVFVGVAPVAVFDLREDLF